MNNTTAGKPLSGIMETVVEDFRGTLERLRGELRDEHDRMLKLKVHAANLEVHAEEQASLIDSLKYNVGQKEAFIDYLVAQHRKEKEALMKKGGGGKGDA